MPSRGDSDPLMTEVDPTVGPEQPGSTPAPHAQVYLVCRQDARLDVVPLAEGGELVVGRTEGAIRVDSPRVSRRHAVFALRGGTLSVEDLGSRNGTRAGPAVLRSERRPLAGGDVVAVGPLVIVVARTDRDLAWSPPVRPGGVDEQDDATGGEAIIVADAAMRALHKVVARLSATSTTVLITGETGTGKEVIADRLHAGSARAAGPFIRINCASLPEALLESELFGHERGAFTGADRRRIGHFEAAAGGTLLLDEIGELPLSLQAKLLRVIEHRTVVRLGSSEETALDVRILCATHRNLEQEVAAGRFRQDLFYRISTFTLEVPPLRERPTEVLLLADAFLRRLSAAAGRDPPVLSGEAAGRLQAHTWPGNVRELRNAMEHAIVMADGGVILPAHLPKNIWSVASIASADAPAPPMRDALEDVERQAIVAALAAENGNRTRAAMRLGISRRALIYKMIKYSLR
jgi:transcriptional regulator with PAS, ATPase and Fis domain